MRDKILVIDDEPNLRKILEALLTREGYEVFCFEGLDEALPTLNTENIDVLITDLSMPGKTGMDVLGYCQNYSPNLPVIIITAFGTIEAAVSALKAGAFDFVLKPFDQGELTRTLKKALESRRKRRRDPEFTVSSGMLTSVGVGPVPIPLFGQEESTIALRHQVDRVSASQSPVLITGEVGSGKRSIAYEIHRRSSRSRHPFVQLHCEAVAEVFQMGEIFGLEKGASPISLFSKPGSLELGANGTLVLEEIGALSPEVQNALFSAFENEYFARSGGAKRFPFEVRIIATSSKDLSQLVQRHQFHEELFYKLSVESIVLKPLRERRQDLVTHLVPYFIERACSKHGVPLIGCTKDVLQNLQQHSWPGNLGELERKIEQWVNLAVSRGQTQIDASLLVLGN